jgi:hypothetical protein
MKLKRANWLFIALVAIPLVYLTAVSFLPTLMITGIHWHQRR